MSWKFMSHSQLWRQNSAAPDWERLADEQSTICTAVWFITQFDQSFPYVYQTQDLTGDLSWTWGPGWSLCRMLIQASWLSPSLGITPHLPTLLSTRADGKFEGWVWLWAQKLLNTHAGWDQWSIEPVPIADAYEKNTAKKSKRNVIPSLIHASLPAVTELRIIIFFWAGNRVWTNTFCHRGWIMNLCKRTWSPPEH